MSFMDRWMFGSQPDELATKVLNGTKTATNALYDGEVPNSNEKNTISSCIFSIIFIVSKAIFSIPIKKYIIQSSKSPVSRICENNL